MTRVVLRTDGGARGNPGPAGAGFVIEVDGVPACSGGKYLGETTNNVAEYEALIWGLENVLASGYDQVTVYADSELLVKQLNGVYRVKSAGLKPLFVKALALVRQMRCCEIVHVRRADNSAADAMANEAMDARTTVGNPACEAAGPDTKSSLF